MSTNDVKMGPEDELAIKSLALYLGAFHEALDGALEYGDNGVNQLAADGRIGVRRLEAEAKRAAARWGVDADGASDWLPSHGPAALLARSLLRRTPSRSVGKKSQCTHLILLKAYSQIHS